MKSDLLLLQQTCLEKDINIHVYAIEGYKCHANSMGNGKGIAVYYKDCFEKENDISKEHYQITKMKSTRFDIICVYRSTVQLKEVQSEFCDDLRKLLEKNRTTFILGDFNSNVYKQSSISKEVEQLGFQQAIKLPTHIQGGLIDHCYVSTDVNSENFTINQKSVYFTDHDIIELRVKKLKEIH